MSIEQAARGLVSGSIRFNTDSSKLEIYNGEQWWEICLLYTSDAADE